MVDLGEVTVKELEYLRAINNEGSPISITSLSRKLGRSASSVYEEITHLVSKGFVTKSHEGVCLTSDGKMLLELVDNSHRIIETWLVSLGFSVEEACRLASKMETTMPIEVLKKLYENMGKPSSCPHGKPITFEDTAPRAASAH
ncbi:metal-dependent transcriptional regulator [Caldivirga sp.]|uniref:metal-dependent transcriptional regulator n=1 Tax=Caldivirga sp. TaxID=2080243 RepID=UPI0025B8D964|nr:metal-dependent transcriptional regulator [Caldivirga sp.]